MCNRKGCGLLQDEEEREEEEEHWTFKRAPCKQLAAWADIVWSVARIWIISPFENLPLWFCEDALKREKMEVEETGETRSSWYDGSCILLSCFYGLTDENVDKQKRRHERFEYVWLGVEKTTSWCRTAILPTMLCLNVFLWMICTWKRFALFRSGETHSVLCDHAGVRYLDYFIHAFK